MKILDNDLLEEFRRLPRCQWCGKLPTFEPRLHAAHVFGKGMGGAYQLDIAWNVIALCALCHNSQHYGGHPLPFELLAQVAAREGVLQDDIRTEIYRLRRLPKGSDPGPRYRQRPAGAVRDPGGGAAQHDALFTAVPGPPPVDRTARLEAHEGGWVAL